MAEVILADDYRNHGLDHLQVLNEMHLKGEPVRPAYFYLHPQDPDSKIVMVAIEKIEDKTPDKVMIKGVERRTDILSADETTRLVEFTYDHRARRVISVIRQM